MSKEEGPGTNTLGQTSSVPPRAASSEPPNRVLPSVPPATDDIDTDWGAEPEVAAPVATASVVTPAVAAAPEAAAPPPMLVAPIANPPPAVVPSASTPPAAASTSGAPTTSSYRPNPLRSQTLIGMVAPVPFQASEPPVERAPNARANPLRSRTLIGLAAPTPPLPEATGARWSAGPMAVAPERVTSIAPSVASVQNSTATPRTYLRTSPIKPSHAPPPVDPDALPAFRNKRGGRMILLLAAAGLSVVFLGYRMLQRADVETPPELNRAATPEASATSAPELTAANAQASSPTSSDSAAEPVAPASAAAADSAAPLSSPESAESVTDAPAAGARTVTINTIPPKARFFRGGKPVGTAPFVVSVPPGQKRAFEVALPGKITRKIVIDGSKPEVTLGLRDDIGY